MTKRKKYWIWGCLGGFVLLILMSKPPEDSSCDPYPEATQVTANAAIESRDLVRDAALSQDGCSLALVLIVNDIITVEAAQELGDNYLRMIKGLGPTGPSDERPSVQIGRGQYDYLIGIYGALSDEQIAYGAKSRNAQKISW